MPLGWRSTTSRYPANVDQVQVDAGRWPRVGGDVLGPFQVADDQLACSLGSGRGECEAAMPHDHGGHAVPADEVARSRFQKTWASRWVCPSINPG